jgi:hypothetical protein
MRVVERMAVKECAPSREAWLSPDEWRDRMPREVKMHQLIDSTGPHQNVLGHTAHRLMMSKRRYRVYMELCRAGRLIERLRSYFEQDPSAYRGEYGAEEIPEAFVWWLFKGLVDACVVLQRGDVLLPVEGWKPLVHNDLHMGNVLLDFDVDEGETQRVSFAIDTFGIGHGLMVISGLTLH